MPGNYDVAVIGAGVFGSWIAWHFAREGKSVLLADAWGPANSRSSSGGESRIIRMGYGADEIYTRMAMRSLPFWCDLSQRNSQDLFLRTGVLWIAREDDPYSQATLRTLDATGVAYDIIRDLAARYPQMRPPEGAFGIFEPGSGALLARRAVAAVVDEAVQLGVTLARDAAPARTTIYACGPWLPKIFPDLLGTRIRTTRQEVYFFSPAAGDAGFAPPSLPAWIDFGDARRPYGLPDLEARGFKLAFDRHGPIFDPDTADRLPAPAGISEARAYLAERFPALRNAPLIESRVCQYENTASGDFLVDRHPEREDVWLAGGGSGHGFKHGPALGEYVCDLILGRRAPEPRFSLAGSSASQIRTVH
jgi:glycine/D-amino acid oxidase-like deaminating enzyme